MFSIHDDGPRFCDGVTRREWLRLGVLGMLGLPALLAAQQTRAATPGRARSCIVMCLLGGPPQHETWDPKPDAPAEIRGDLRPIQSATPGVLVGELMPRTARLTERIAVLRAMQTNDSSHSSSGYYMTTGYPHQPLGVENARAGAPNNSAPWCAGSRRPVDAAFERLDQLNRQYGRY